MLKCMLHLSVCLLCAAVRITNSGPGQLQKINRVKKNEKQELEGFLKRMLMLFSERMIQPTEAKTIKNT